ncbi:GNAT family N-acetyltransferase [Paenibacillus polysaccharolyticus]|uniref:GNAT family N-acetyltransferase n=1 Tax=Paenibacillus polysaccharolyticus TaxID=582692 RepID=UPI00203BA239|nr:GNAT family N-acetyltransferase [Paenibacillus polysaccharolyticus]MCM3132969.1 GNAT family N-acetyltransferase [Paenibacillus polysaccharolyticus]
MLELEFSTIETWDEALWARMERIYREAFPTGAKTKAILCNMLDRGIGYLHMAAHQENVVAMAVTGLVGKGKERLLIVDYLAVEQKLRGSGIGTWMLKQLRAWATKEHGVEGIIIEAESGMTEAHLERIQFWQRNGFVLTSYVHQYSMVPEPYQAMKLLLDRSKPVLDDGKAIFKYINAFHKVAYRKS